MPSKSPSATRQLAAREKDITVLDLLDRILNKGVILYGDLTLSVANVDLVYLSLKVLLTSIEKAEEMRRAGTERYLQTTGDREA